MGWFLKEAEVRYRRGVRMGAERHVRGSVDVDAIVHQADDELRCASSVDERMIALALDAKNRVIGWHLVGKGGATSCAVEQSALWRALVMLGAAGVVLVHNHPSGQPTPSADDVAITERIRRSGELLGIRVRAHVIVTAEPGEYFSFRDGGLL
jgi:DNA repair protein RadC